MRALRALPVALAFVAMPGAQCAPQSTDMLDKIVAQEQAEIESLRQYSPVVETYIQIRRPDKQDRKSTRLNSSHGYISYAVFCLKKKKKAISTTTSKSKHTITTNEQVHAM